MKFIKVSFTDQETPAADATAQALIHYYKYSHWWHTAQNVYVLHTQETPEQVFQKISLPEDYGYEGTETLDLKIVGVAENDKFLSQEARQWIIARKRSKIELKNVVKSPKSSLTAKKNP